MGRHDYHPPQDTDELTVDLSDVVEDDVLLDVIGAHRAPEPAAPADIFVQAWPRARTDQAISGRLPSNLGDPLSELFVTWREELTEQPVPAPPDVQVVVSAVAASARSRRTGRPVIGIAAAICALLVGSALVGARAAHPGDMLFPVTQVLWSDRADSLVAGETARNALTSARTAINAGLTDDAKTALGVATTAIPKVKPRDGKEALQTDLNALWAALRSAGGTEPEVVAAGVAGPVPQPSPATGLAAAPASRVSSEDSGSHHSSASMSLSGSSVSTTTSSPSGPPSSSRSSVIPVQPLPPAGSPSLSPVQPPAPTGPPPAPSSAPTAPSSGPPASTVPSPTSSSSPSGSAEPSTSAESSTPTTSADPTSPPTTSPPTTSAAPTVTEPAVIETRQQSVGGETQVGASPDEVQPATQN